MQRRNVDILAFTLLVILLGFAPVVPILSLEIITPGAWGTLLGFLVIS